LEVSIKFGNRMQSSSNRRFAAQTELVTLVAQKKFTVIGVTRSPSATNHHLPTLGRQTFPGEDHMFTFTKTATLASAAMAIALATAAQAAPAPTGSAGKAIAANDDVHCYGLHSCKGNSDCKTAEHDCKGMNACKGHGFKAMKAGECLKRGGTIGDIG
jgi:hypothetical protein